METLICPKGHTSTESDYCSECGARMDSAPSAPVVSTPSEPTVCPDCSTPRDHLGVIFCELCGYNYATGAHGQIPVTPEALPQAPPAGPPAPAPAAGPGPAPAAAPAIPLPPPAASARWSVEVTVDPALHEPGSPDPPAGLRPFVFSLTQPVTLIGRKSESRAVFPEIPLQFDDAVSHRHALLELAPDGSLNLRDIGSSNGTRLNGSDIPPMTDYPLKSGDQITLGHWTRISISAA
jgi:hypothetical protein